MSTNWFSDFLSEKTKLKACRYLLHHYLGDLLKDNVSLEQLSVDIFNGRGTIENLSLDDEFINHWLKNYSVPVELVSSIIDRITVTIPWSTLLGSSTLFEVHGLNLILKPKCRHENGPSFEEMVSSMTSMTSSLQMAEEMLKNEKTEKNSKYDGANIFADTIDSVLSRVKVSINDISICLDHLVKDSSNQKLRLEMRIQRMDFFDDMAVNESVTTDSSGRKKWEPSAIACKNFKLSGVTFHVEEYMATPTDICDISRSSSSDSSTQLFESAHSSPPLTKSNPTSPDVMTQQPTSFSAMNSLRVPPIQIAALAGTSEVKMKMKQNEAVSGPKLEVDVQIGALDILMSPHQVHILLEILSCFTNPASSMASPTRPCRTTDKPMKQMDYLRVEDQLQKHLMTTHTKDNNLTLSETSDEVTIGLQGPDDYEEGEEMYYSLFPSNKGVGHDSDMESSTYSNMSERSTSTAASGISSSTRSRHNSQSGSRASKDPVQKLLDDPSVELSKLRLKMSSLTMTVLHENPATNSAEEKEPFEKLKKITNAFFGKIRMIIGDMILSDMKDIRSKISEACPYDHLGMICRSIVLDSSQKSSANHSSMALDCSVVLMDVVECLFDRDNSTAPMHGFTLPIDRKLPEYCELLTFAKFSPPNMGSMSMYNSFHCQNPALKLSVISVNKPKMSHRHANIPKTEISIELGQFTSEVDITIIDRINSLLKSDLVRPPDQNITGGVRFMSQSPYTSLTTQALYERSTTDEKRISLKVSSSFCTLCVRFPVPDLRSEPQVDRLPWWKRNLHKESLVLKLNEAIFQTVLGSNESRKQCELKCHSINGALHESADSLPINFINVEPDDDESTHSYGFNWPRMVITHTQDLNSVLEEDSGESDESTNLDSLNGACQFRKAESSPFSTKKFMYHKEEVSDKSEVKNVSEEHVLPGDKEELREFQEKTAANSCLLIEITVPKGDVFFHNKEFYELIYNRLCNDLLLWEPTAPSPLYSQEQSLLLPQTLETQYRVQYIPPDFMSEARNFESDSDSDESQGMHSFAPFEQRSFHKKKSRERKFQSKLSFVLNLNKGNIHMASKNAPEEGVLGEMSTENSRNELAIYAKDATLFVVVNHNGDPDLQFICFQSNKIELFHNPCVEITKSSEEKPSSQADLFSTIKKSEFTFDKNGRPVGCGPDSLDMFSVAVKVKFDTKIDLFNYPAMKEFTIAVGVQGATLNHKISPLESSWFSQALEFMNVVDYPIKGYVQPQILSQLHVHLWNCTVDYRPVHLPLCTLLHTEWLSLSSNIFAESMSTMLRFQFERTGLFISENPDDKFNLKDYVCVADWDRFELCVRTSGEKETKIPKRDVTLGSNRINVRTCSDSCIALMELIQYVANDGDLAYECMDDDDVSSTTTKTDQDDPDIAAMLSSAADPAVMDSTILVHDMMEDAMKESAMPDNTAKTSHGSHSRRSSGAKNPVTEVYFMPPKEEKQSLYAHPTAADAADDPPPPPPSVDISASSSSRSLFSSTMSEENTELSIDEDYCILDDVGMGVEPRDNCPEIKVYTKQPLQLKENYFYQPLGRQDALKSPEHFPVPETRHTLKEMSIHWFMYGGSDFGPAPVKKENFKKKSTACDTNSTLQGYRDAEIEYHKKTMKERNRLITPYDQGGPGRDTNVLMELQLSKVRMLHETYPANCEQVSRQVLLIHDIEVLDRLSSSPYNKFLYQYTSESTPRQTYANMLVIKALHTRPDPAVPAEECALKISVQPIKLNIDQDALFFLMKFMSDIMYGSSTEELKPRRSPEHEFKNDGSRRSSHSSAPLPILSTATQSVPNTEEVERQQELLIKFDVKESVNLPTDSPSSTYSETKENRSPSQPTYFKSVVFSPDLHIRLDYNGKRVDMEQGTIAGLLVGLAQLNCSELKLRRINYRHGLLGIQRVLVSLLTDWLDDIKKNQIPRILGGVGPIHSVVQLIQGIKDLFWLPIEQYRRDGRIVRGLQRGASSFTTSTAMAVLELTNRLVKSIQYLAMLTYDMVSPGPSVRQPARQHRRVHKRSKQPTDIREGMTNAYIVLKQGISDTAETIVRAATEEHEQKGMTGAVGGVIRQIPPTMVQPIILASEATSNVLGGMRNQLVPDARREDVEKWKVPTS